MVSPPEADRLPIVFLPGIMGSRLAWRDGSRRTWDPDSNWSMLDWIRLGRRGGEHLARAIHHLTEVDVMRVAPGLSPEQERRGWAGVAQGYYKNFLVHLAARGWPTYAIGYDWRRDILDEAGALEARLNAMGPDGPFLLVTHSMGGLLARAALATRPNLARRVCGVIHLCQPCHGAPVLYRRMFTGCNADYDGNGWVDSFFCSILGRTSTQFLTNLCGMPGAMQLLPWYEYEFPVGTRLGGWQGHPDKFVAGLYQAAASPPGILPPTLAQYVRTNLGAGLGRIERFHAEAKVYHRRTWFIVGTDLETDVAIFHGGGKTAPVRLPIGDGVVPAFSAAPCGSDPVALDTLLLFPGNHRQGLLGGLNHSNACNDPRIMSGVDCLAAYITQQDRRGDREGAR